ncbi:MAG: hypothetical protein V7638_804 [Acidobacteriota bacterium]|jgi:hypothetical protein
MLKITILLWLTSIKAKFLTYNSSPAFAFKPQWFKTNGQNPFLKLPDAIEITYADHYDHASRPQ